MDADELVARWKVVVIDLGLGKRLRGVLYLLLMLGMLFHELRTKIL